MKCGGVVCVYSCLMLVLVCCLVDFRCFLLCVVFMCWCLVSLVLCVSVWKCCWMLLLVVLNIVVLFL